MNNGKVNGKQRFRCHNCGYSETQNSVSHNSNVRTGCYYYSKRSDAKLVEQKDKKVTPSVTVPIQYHARLVTLRDETNEKSNSIA